MEKNLINVGSITQAMRAKDVLKSFGFNAYMERNNNHLDRKGCGYSIYTDDCPKEQAIEILKTHRVKVYDESSGDLQ